MPKRRVDHYRTAAFDVESDPFKAGRVPVPFACEFLADDGVNLKGWGPGCIDQVMRQIAALPEKYLIFAHAGGRFDFQFLWDYIEEPVFIVNGRLVEFCQGVERKIPHHLWRDSYMVIPVALEEFRKEEIDYAILEADRRDLPRNRLRIEQYLHSDVLNLLELVQRFRTRFEDRTVHLPITIGQLAMRELRQLHSFDRASEGTDALMRPFYFGGRNQCFAAGVIEGPWICLDVNSHYAKAMRDFDHPLTDMWIELDKPPRSDRTVWFARVRARNRQALPWRDPEQPVGIRFDMAEAEFWACSHELVPAIAAGMVEVLDWIEIWRPATHGRFRAFVDTWYGEKLRARRRGDNAAAIFAKGILNSASGKFGQDPRRFTDWKLLRNPFLEHRLAREGFEPATIIRSEPPEDWLELWTRPSKVMRHSFFNVGIAASITSASRRIMLDGLRTAVDPIYCDTDSVVCRAFSGPRNKHRLGAWKVECQAEFAAIAGKKTYCLFDRVGRKIRPIKWASKGGSLTPIEIIRLAEGGVVEKTNEAPIFSLHGHSAFNTREYKKTVDSDVAGFRV